MKKLIPGVGCLLIIAVFTACGKHAEKPDADTSTPLVKEISATSSNYHQVFEYSYDDEKRLISISYSAITNPITYSTGIFQIVNTSEANKKKVAYFSLEGGRIKTAIYNIFIDEVNQNTPATAAFSYDAKGRLIKIEQTITDPVPPHSSSSLIYTFTWDGDDNLIASSRYNPSRQTRQYNATYSGFSAENTNTLMAKNVGLDYFGTASYNGEFYPAGDGTSGGMLPLAFAGKLLPTKITANNGNVTSFNMAYHKNAQGNIDRIEQTNVADANT